MKIGKDEIGVAGIFGLVLLTLGPFLTTYGVFFYNVGLIIIGPPMFILGTVVYHIDLFSHRKQREGIVEAVMKPQQEAKATPSAAALTCMDELKKLKELLDMGAITQEEFEQKKKRILEKM